MSKNQARATVLVFVIAVAFRLAFFVFALHHLPVSSDEAWPSLMALHMLKGEFPVVYWGQTYMGTQESFVDAALMLLLGPHTLTVRLYPFAFGLAFVLVTFVLARRIYAPATGLIALALLAVPAPYLTMCSVMIPPDNYLAMTTLGSVSLVLLHDLAVGPPGRRRHLKAAALGLTLGFTFWLHILVVSYIGIAILFLFIRDKRLPFRREFWIACAAFVAGSAPLLVYNLRHHFATFTDVAQTVTLQRSWELLQEAFGATLHFLIGMKVMLYGDNADVVSLPPAMAAALGIAWAAVLLLVLARHIAPLFRLAFLSARGMNGTTILVAMAAASIFVFCRSSRSGWDNVRYILPAASALPVLFAHGLDRVRLRSGLAFAVLLGVVLISQAWGNALLWRAWSNPDIVGVDLELPDTAGLLRFLDSHGIRRAYAHLWISYRITFETQEQLICAEPFNERFPGRKVKFLGDVRSSTNIAYIEHPTMRFMDGFEEALQRAGGTWKKAQMDRFTVYHDFTPPYGRGPLVELPRHAWHATATHGGDRCPAAFDGSVHTRWDTDGPQRADMEFQVDLGSTQSICMIRFELGSWIGDYPRGCTLEVSEDAATWRTVFSNPDMTGHVFWEEGHPQIFAGGRAFATAFAPLPARYVRIRQTGSDPVCDWSIAELRMFGPAPAP